MPARTSYPRRRGVGLGVPVGVVEEVSIKFQKMESINLVNQRATERVSQRERDLVLRGRLWRLLGR